jgi:hypothetical protein
MRLEKNWKHSVPHLESFEHAPKKTIIVIWKSSGAPRRKADVRRAVFDIFLIEAFCFGGCEFTQITQILLALFGGVYK